MHTELLFLGIATLCKISVRLVPQVDATRCKESIAARIRACSLFSTAVTRAGVPGVVVGWGGQVILSHCPETAAIQDDYRSQSALQQPHMRNSGAVPIQKWVAAGGKRLVALARLSAQAPAAWGTKHQCRSVQPLTSRTRWQMQTPTT